MLVLSVKSKSCMRVIAECNICWFYWELPKTIDGLVPLIYNKQIFMPYMQYSVTAKPKRTSKTTFSCGWNENHRENRVGLNVLVWIKLLSYSLQARFQGSFWFPANKSEPFISACHPGIHSDCSRYCQTSPIDSSGCFVTGFLTAY